MRKIYYLLLILFCSTACKSSKTVKNVPSKSETVIVESELSPVTEKIINHAKKFKGTKYKYGGVTKKGMDCSGLIYTAFKEEAIALPRISSDMAKSGDWIDLKKVKAGDLLFFATRKNSRKINHVGLVVNSSLGRVEFIHSTTSSGVITSLLSERYWYFSFVQARRVL